MAERAALAAEPRCSQPTELSAAVRLEIRGHVQGVGFRPFAQRLAASCELAGSVRNTSAGVRIDLEGSPEALAAFEVRLMAEAPEDAAIAAVERMPLAPLRRRGFVIETSAVGAGLAARVPVDRATCAACRRELFDPTDRRHGYPFTSCTACGPRLSIIERMPYDRAATAMRHFEPCRPCTDEVGSSADRRFHAQANACAACGPRLALLDRHGKPLAAAGDAVAAAANLLRHGGILALKGLGGYQLLALADQGDAVRRLRERKRRPTKPLAVMAPCQADAEALVELSALERRTLVSPQNPILLAKRRTGNESLAEEVAPGLKTLGVMLPTTPAHHLLLAELGRPVVATSGNRAAEPIAIDDGEAVARLGDLSEALLVHDRQILNRLDDSVVRVVAGQATMLRLARGYAPLPLPALEGHRASSTLALGGHQKSALAFWSGAQAALGPYLGDLDLADTRAAFSVAAENLPRLFGFEPTLLACDLHPEYFTTHWANTCGRPTIPVQHHHAHALACMTEHGLVGEEALAFAWDGSGYGPDGTLWGGEALQVHGASFERAASLLPFPLPGGDAAIREPRRAAFGLLYVLLGEEALLAAPQWLKLLGLKPAAARLLAEMIRRRVNTPWTTSVGRLFDGIAALVLGAGRCSYEGEAAARLEAAADEATAQRYELPLLPRVDSRADATYGPLVHGDWRPLLASVLADVNAEADAGLIAARFHNALAEWAVDVAAWRPRLKVVLSGGCFQNRLLTERTRARLMDSGREVYAHGLVPPNDGGLAVGQLAVALSAAAGRHSRG